MNVLMISSEAVPFAKSGGLADVVTSLTKTLAELGHDARLLLPRYSFIPAGELTLLPERITVPLGFDVEECAVYTGTLPGSSAPVYFLDHPLFSARNGLYGEKGTHTYRDNHRRFALLSRAPFALCHMLAWKPDILHAHDWQSAPAAAYLWEYGPGEECAATRSVFTIHNIGYQGIFSKHDLHVMQLHWDNFHRKGDGSAQQINFLKAGILNADAVTTVSPTYAREIRTPEFGHGMEGLLNERSNKLTGILNGVDYSEWNPESDPHIPRPFSAEDLSGKDQAKRALQEKVGLPVSSEVPLIGIVSRLAEQKGFYELCDPRRGSLKRICDEMSVQMVILGTGEDWIEQQLLHLDAILPNLKVFDTFSNSLAHLIEAGSDLFLMPSRYEPCGLNQIYSLRYGTLPIVRKTGGLADTVENYNPETGEGTGFVFDDLSPESIYGTVEWAVSTWYERRDVFKAMQQRAMQRHFSWKDSARQYLELYARLQSSGDTSTS
jgi:starch synthase